VAVGDQVAVPAQYGFGAYQQPDAAEHVAGQPVQESGEERPVSGGEPDLLAAQLPLEDRDLVPKSQDLRVLGSVAQRQQPEQRERIGHAEVCQSKEHNRASSPSYPRRSDARWNVDRRMIPFW
jgi:hypothetical protein